MTTPQLSRVKKGKNYSDGRALLSPMSGGGSLKGTASQCPAAGRRTRCAS